METNILPPTLGNILNNINLADKTRAEIARLQEQIDTYESAVCKYESYLVNRAIRLMTGTYHFSDPREFSYSEETKGINFVYTEYGSDGDPDENHMASIPVQFFLIPNQEEAYSAYRQFKSEENRKTREAELKQMDIESEARARATYEELKKRFENKAQN